MRFKTSDAQICPYCMEYRDSFHVCSGCGLIVCEKECSIELFKDGKALCCDCIMRESILYKLSHLPSPEDRRMKI